MSGERGRSTTRVRVSRLAAAQAREIAAATGRPISEVIEEAIDARWHARAGARGNHSFHEVPVIPFEHDTTTGHCE